MHIFCMINYKCETPRFRSVNPEMLSQELFLFHKYISNMNTPNSSKRVFVAFPPNLSNISVKNEAKGSLIIGRKKLLDAQFPERVTKSDGFILQRPAAWI